MQMRGTRAARLTALVSCAVVILSLGAAAQSRGSRNFLWKVTAGDKVLYLAGSVHALSADVYPLNPPYEQAFAAAGTLVEEIDLAEADSLATAPALIAKGMYRDGRRFDTVVSKETATLVAARLKQAGLPVEMFQMMKPWMVMLAISALEMQRAGLDVRYGLDKHFYDRAKTAGKEVVGLETAESQIDRLDIMPEALQEQLLRSSLSEIDTQRKYLKSIVSAWRRGDAATIENTLLTDFYQYPVAYRSLIVERNHNWIPQIEACFVKTQPCMVVVGAAHLVGPDGLIAILERRGYRLEQQ